MTVSASYIDSILNGTKPRVDADDVNFFPFVERNKNLDVNDLKSDAINALKVVISDLSELKELWEDDEDLYPKWKGHIEALIERLK